MALSRELPHTIQSVCVNYEMPCHIIWQMITDNQITYRYALQQLNLIPFVIGIFTLGHLTPLTHWGRMTHICVGELTIIGSDNGLSPGRRQAIIWTNAGILLIEPLGTNFSEILIGIKIFSFKKMRLKMASAKWHPFCLGLNVLTPVLVPYIYSTQTRT